MNQESINKVALRALSEATDSKGKVSRSKAFAIAFTTVAGSQELTDGLKKAIRSAIDAELAKEMALKIELAEQVKSVSRYVRLNSNLEVETGRKIETTETATKTELEEILLLRGELFALRVTMSNTKGGASEAQLRRQDRIIKAIKCRLYNLRGAELEDHQNDEVNAIERKIKAIESGEADEAMKDTLAARKG